nr:MAG TPA: hypothetical protein [Bacteriophage sp.]
MSFTSTQRVVKVLFLAITLMLPLIIPRPLGNQR